MSKSLRKVFGAVAAFLLFPACKPGVPSDLIQPAELEGYGRDPARQHEL